ncbi:MAG: 1-deoxy-D-xylulose-5-phosphate synthase [candidate division NC10 bacterium]|nr:1-deoxy-D-xylulose-5-phosphate synthase [candidate division NC10 bacterium]
MLLEKIQSPKDLKALSRPDLSLLAQEVRDLIIQTVSKTGGHLASSLGAVEITIALHYIFNVPQDRLIWDVGHQAYAHKILTERRDRFWSLRQEGGISGFPKREESPYDLFNTGHASTAISAALGMAEARDLAGQRHHVIAVVGDGSLTGGLAWEGLNQAGHLKRDLIVILNDNSMSISPNVGAISAYLNRIMTGEFLTRLRGEAKEILEHIPKIGPPMLKVAKRLEEVLKSLLVPGILFEELGFTYVGPLDGHNLTHLMDAFENVKRLKGPVLVHVLTEKGRGYKPAKEDPTSFHSAPPFDLLTGKFLKKPGPITYTQAFSQALVQLAREDERIVAITAAMPDGTGLSRFAKEFPKRFYDVGIAEQHAVTFAAGLACEGYLPVAAIYSTFLQRAYDQVLHDVCLQDLPVTFALDRGGIVGEDGATHNGIYDLSYLRPLPHMVVMAPKDENELQHMLKTAIYHPGPAALRYPRGQGHGVPLEERARLLPLGRAEVLLEGEDLALWAVGAMVYPALQAAEELRREGIEITVVNARFIKPLDEELLFDQARRIGRVLTVEENVLPGGFGAAVLEALERRGLARTGLRRVGLPDQVVEQGSPAQIRERFGLTAKGIAQTAREALEVRQPERVLRFRV